MRLPVSIALLLALSAPLACAENMNFLRVCGDPAQSAAEAANFCQRALDAGGLSAAQESAAAANLGAALLELDRPAEAVRAYDRAVEAGPATAFVHAGRARARAALDDAAAAAVDWNRAVALAPDDAETRAGRGAFRLRAGNATGALDDFETAERLGGRDPSLHFNRALALARVGREDEAEDAFSDMLRTHPSDASIWIERARLRLPQNPEAALADYDQAVAHAREWSQPWFERGMLLEQMGRADEAGRDFRRAWELGHSDPALSERILRLGQ